MTNFDFDWSWPFCQVWKQSLLLTFADIVISSNGIKVTIIGPSWPCCGISLEVIKCWLVDCDLCLKAVLKCAPVFSASDIDKYCKLFASDKIAAAVLKQQGNSYVDHPMIFTILLKKV